MRVESQYYKQHKDTIYISSIFNCNVSLFKLLEPEYQNLPEGYDTLIYIPNKSYKIISSRGFPTMNNDPSWKDGDRYIKRVDEFILLKNHILRGELELDSYIEQESKKINVPYYDKRREEYPLIEDLVVALWEKIVENKDSKLLDLQQKRTIIKNKYPKED